MQVLARTDPDAALRSVEDVLDSVAGLQAFWDSLADWWGTRTARAFKNLKPLDAATVRRKGHATPLVDTGGLLEAVLSGAPAKRSRLDAAFGVPKGHRVRPLGLLHRNGTSRMPVRNPVPGADADDADEVRQRLREFILRESR
jgi:hypothetical protein